MENEDDGVKEAPKADGEPEQRSTSQEDALDDDKATAAAMIQRNYRGYRERRQMKGMGMSASTRWSEAIKDLQYRERTRPKSRDQELAEGDEHTRARRNWQKLSTITGRAGADDTDDDSDEEIDAEDGLSPEQIEQARKRRHEAKAEREKTAKQMDLPYWLEMVDSQHRYGSNLRAYHEQWLKTDTHENFFYWLDQGEGKTFEHPIVPRSRLDSEKVRYLSREERLNYLVRIDKEGRLCWAHNGMRITTSTAYKDSVDGIVPKEDNEHQPWNVAIEEPGAFTSDDASSTLSTGHVDEPEGEHYVNHELTKAKGVKKLKYVSAATILNRLLQKSVKPNSWIFVADTSFRLYVGIKQSGAFQHSSFLHGSRISAAGLIKIKDGQLRKLSPLSGHYRPPTKNFRQFVHCMKDNGVDMSHVSISRSYAILVGLEMYVRTRKKIKHGIHHVEDEKDKIAHPEEVKQREEEEKDKSRSAEKEREVVERQRRKEAEDKRRNSFPYRLMNKFRSKPSSLQSQPPKSTPAPESMHKGQTTSSPQSATTENPEDGTSH